MTFRGAIHDTMALMSSKRELMSNIDAARSQEGAVEMVEVFTSSCPCNNMGQMFVNLLDSSLL